MNEKQLHRRIRSFVKREGRMTQAQQCAIETLYPIYGLPIGHGLLNIEQVFGRQAKTVLEIGFGMGQSLVTLALLRPEINFIGIEVHSPGVGSLLRAIEENNIQNIRIYREDAVDVLNQCIVNESLDIVQVFFPDPWPKRKHSKRRLIQTSFVEIIYHKLKEKGFLHLATDWQDYAEHMSRVLSQHTGFKCVADATILKEFISRPATKFEKRGEQLGHRICDLQFIKSSISSRLNAAWDKAHEISQGER